MPNGAVSVSPSSTTMSSAGIPTSWPPTWAQVVSGPGPWSPAAGPDDGLARHVHLEVGRVEHLDAEDVVLAAVARAERLGHGGDPEAEQPAPLTSLGLLAPEILVADGR